MNLNLGKNYKFQREKCLENRKIQTKRLTKSADVVFATARVTPQAKTAGDAPDK